MRPTENPSLKMDFAKLQQACGRVQVGGRPAQDRELRVGPQSTVVFEQRGGVSLRDPSELVQSFKRFADRECGASPLYRRLAYGIATGPEVLALAAHGEAGPKPNLLLASVHYLLLRGVPHELAAFYPTVSESVQTAGDPYPALRAFCLENATAVQNLMETRLVQTNEVARSAVLFAAYGFLEPRLKGRPLALIEIGASAGLLLFWDQYSYDYGGEVRCGLTDGLVQIRCDLEGPRRPPFPLALPSVNRRVGIDLHPVDVRNPDSALWLQALVWGDQPDRLRRLRQAISVVAHNPPRLLAGDALEVLPNVLSALSPDEVPLVFHSHTLNQFTPGARRAFKDLLVAQSGGRELIHVSMEWLSGGELPELEVTAYSCGSVLEQRVLSRYEAHGDWLEWQ